jgi:hypothetical protein
MSEPIVPPDNPTSAVLIRMEAPGAAIRESSEEAVRVLRALADQQERAEPVAWAIPESFRHRTHPIMVSAEYKKANREVAHIRDYSMPLYAHPPAGQWVSVKERLPRCSRDENALGTPVLIWPRNLPDYTGDGFAYFGRRATGSPAFYLHGAAIHGVTYWMPLPPAPKEG